MLGMSILSRSVLTVIFWRPEVEVVKSKSGTSIVVKLLTVFPRIQVALTTSLLTQLESCLLLPALDHQVEVWDLEKKQARTFAGHTAEITSVVFAGDLVISAGRDKTIRVWNVDTGALVSSWETPSEINGIALNPNGDLLATANVDSTIRTWDIKSGSLKNTFSGHSAQAWAVRFSPDGTSLVSASSGSHIDCVGSPVAWPFSAIKSCSRHSQ